MSTYFLNNLIKKASPNLTVTDELIAENFLSIGDDLVNYPISEMADKIGVSTGAIFTFVKKLGFQGYKDFKIAIASNKSTSQSSPGPSLATIQEVSIDDGPILTGKKVIGSMIEALFELSEDLSSFDLEEVIKIIESANRLYFFGIGGSSIIALDAYHQFLRTTFDVNFISDVHMQLSQSTKLKKDDVALIFSHSGKARQPVEIAKNLYQSGIKTLIFTGNPMSELNQYATQAIIINSSEAILHSEAVASRFLYMAIIDILYTNLTLKNAKQNSEALKKIRSTLSKDKIH